jgi:hypothetical protein
MVAMTFFAAGVPVVNYKVDYDDIPSWYGTLQGQPEWNNKKQFPGGYFQGEWITESELFLTRLSTAIPDAYATVVPPPSPSTPALPPAIAEIVKNNVFMRIFPQILGKADVVQEITDEVWIPLDKVGPNRGSQPTRAPTEAPTDASANRRERQPTRAPTDASANRRELCWRNLVLLRSLRWRNLPPTPPPPSALIPPPSSLLPQHLSDPSNDFLQGASLTNADARFAYFAFVVNAIGLAFEGETFIPKACTHLYSYLERCHGHPVFKFSRGFHEEVTINVVLTSFVSIFEKKGMTMKPLAVPIEDVPVDSCFTHYEFKSKRAYPYVRPTFDPPLSPPDLLRYENVEKLIRSMDNRYPVQEYMIVFIGAYDADHVDGSLNKPIGVPPLANYNNEPTLTSVCAMSSMVAMTCEAMGVATAFYKIDYEDRDFWYSHMSNNEAWNSERCN